MGPGGQVSCPAGRGWGFEADAGLIPTNSPMMSRTRMTHPRPGLLFEDRADQGTLACLEHVRFAEGDPEAL